MEDARAAAQGTLDAEPCRPGRPVTTRKYKPGTRHEPATRGAASGEGSWWTRPGANFAAEAQRMRDSPTKVKVPGETNIVGWNASF